MWLLSSSKNIVPIKSNATFKSSKFATLPQDLPSLFICLFIFPNTCVGNNPSQFQGVGGSEMIKGIEAFNDCSAFDVECCCGLDRR